MTVLPTPNRRFKKSKISEENFRKGIDCLYKFAKFGKIASGIFHDILNPLSVVTLSVEELSKNHKQIGAEANKCIKKAIKASRKMESFMKTAKKQLASGDQKKFFFLNKEINEVIKLLSHKSQKANVAIKFFPEKNRLILYGNQIKFFRAIVNLVSNAIEAYEENIESRDKKVIISTSSDEKKIIIYIKDFAGGIDKKTLIMIFEPFFTTKAKTGTGLGLTIAKDIVEKDFDGKISVISVKKQYTVFTITIPKP